ncbi:MAG: tetratricopeptide repeat protein, partial [Oscillospiraceae bacterium]
MSISERITELENKILVDSNNRELCKELRSLYHKSKQYQRAIDFARQIIDQKGASSDLLSCVGVGFLGLGQYEKAIENFQRAIELDPIYAYPWHGLGTVYYYQKNYEKTIEYLRKAIELDPTFTYPWHGLGAVFFMQNNNEEAIEHYQKAIELEPIYADAWHGLGSVYFEQENYEEAIKHYQKAIELDPIYADAWRELGSVYYVQDDYEKAIEAYQNAISINQLDGKSYYRLGLLYKEKNNPDYALEVLTKALCVIPKTDIYWYSDLEFLKYKIEGLMKQQINLEKSGEISPDPLIQILRQTRIIEKKSIENKKRLNSFLQEKPNIDPNKGEHYFEVLRRWNSYTPIIGDGHFSSKGGGYFIKYQGYGIVIDPGFNFIDNFKEKGHEFREITHVFISHAHNDHAADLESILTLLFKYNEEIKDSDDDSKMTIRKEIAEENNCKHSDVTREMIEKKFANSKRRNIIHIYITSSVFKKYNGMLNLFKSDNYELHFLEAEKIIEISDLKISVTKAFHYDILSDKSSVGLSFAN